MIGRLDIYCEFENAAVEVHRSYILKGAGHAQEMQEYFRICADDFSECVARAIDEKAGKLISDLEVRSALGEIP